MNTGIKYEKHLVLEKEAIFAPEELCVFTTLLTNIKLNIVKIRVKYACKVGPDIFVLFIRHV